jgi:hypothetical protein
MTTNHTPKYCRPGRVTSHAAIISKPLKTCTEFREETERSDRAERGKARVKRKIGAWRKKRKAGKERGK